MDAAAAVAASANIITPRAACRNAQKCRRAPRTRCKMAEGAHFCGGAKNDPHAGGGGVGRAAPPNPWQSAGGALHFSLGRIAEKFGSGGEAHTQNEGGYISLCLTHWWLHLPTTMGLAGVNRFCRNAPWSLKWPSCLGEFVTGYASINIFAHWNTVRERERHCIAKTGFTPRSYNIIEAAAAKANIKKFFCSFSSHNMSNNRPWY